MKGLKGLSLLLGLVTSSPMAASSSSGSVESRRVRSVIEDHGVYSTPCGYCNSSTRTSTSHGIRGHRLTVEDYQELLDRGWRRSGLHIYKPDCSKTCCPPYTIRLDVEKFFPSKEQKRVLRRMNRYLDGYDPSQIEVPEGRKRMESTEPVDEVPAGMLARLKEVIGRWLGESGLADIELPNVTVRRVSEKIRKQLKNVDGEAHYTSNAAFLVAAAVKKLRKNDTGVQVTEVSPTELASSLASALTEQGIDNVKACKGHLNFYISGSAHQNSEPMAVQVDDKPTVSSNGCELRRKRKLEVLMQRSSFDPEEFQLYKRYQIAVHRDLPEDVKESSYRRFLVDTPLVPVQVGSVSYGSFHQQYRIDGQLVAVGVVDVLPRCLSSKYLFWDPDFAFLSLGKFSALQEIEWVQAAHQSSTALQYYYMGYYIHKCPKMRYKAAYSPSDLLCPIDFRWSTFHLVRPLVETGASVCICDAESRVGKGGACGSDVQAVADQHDGDVNDAFEEYHCMQPWEQDNLTIEESVWEKLGNVLIIRGGRCTQLKDWEVVWHKTVINSIKQRIYQYWQLVGDRLAFRMCYVV